MKSQLLATEESTPIQAGLELHEKMPEIKGGGRGDASLVGRIVQEVTERRRG